MTRLKVLTVVDSCIKLRTLSSSSLEKLSLSIVEFDRTKPDTSNLTSLALLTYHGTRNNNQVKLVEFGFPLEVKHLQRIEFNLMLGELRNPKTLVCKRITPDFRLAEFKLLIRTELMKRLN